MWALGSGVAAVVVSCVLCCAVSLGFGDCIANVRDGARLQRRWDGHSSMFLRAHTHVVALWVRVVLLWLGAWSGEGSGHAPALAGCTQGQCCAAARVCGARCSWAARAHTVTSR